MSRTTHLRRNTALAIAATAVLVACGGSTADTPDATTAPAPAASGAVLPDPGLVAVGGSIGDVSRDALDIVLEQTGVTAIDPDVAAVVLELEAGLLADWAGAAASTPVPFGRSRSAGAAPGQGATDGALGIGVLYAVVSQALDSAERRPDPLADDARPEPGENHVTVEGSTVDVLVAEQRSADGVTLDSSVSGRLVACPDAGGAVEASLSSITRITTGDPAGASAGSSYELQVDLRATVDDEAHLAGFEMTLDGGVAGFGRDVRGDTRSGAGYSIEGGSTSVFTAASGGDLTVTGVTGPGITRTSSVVEPEQAQAFIDQQFKIGLLLAKLVLADLERVWRSGACIEVTLHPDVDPTSLAAGEAVGVGLVATSKEDAASITGRAVTTVSSGAVTVAPAETTVPEGVVTVTMGDPAGPATVTVEVRSVRGIGTATLDLGAAQGWTADGQLDVFRVSGTTCGPLSGTWTLDLEADFDGARFTGTLALDLTGGTFTLAGVTSGGGFSLPQQGGGTVEIVEHDDGTATLVLSGSAWAGGPAGTRELALRPATDAC